ncbi:PREDICTED: organic cation transporter protein-like [Nicrophorus vespilloides]|uniref:Organic cation transporter protein-like n=1 Tax=Nicrophorus vespilloides TaxID=110193 RepID=A0ABM1MDA2_NICVS|nr:PREDICTED: organic cation transporter protein-like [Nicrophorus vespilloides]
MAYDDVIPLLGNFGRYQKRIYLLLCLPAIICAFHKLGNVFLGAKPDYRCQLPDEFPNATYALSEEQFNASYPWDYKNNKFDTCLMKVDGEEISCDHYIYDYSKYESSAVIEWDMVCGKSYMRATGDALFMVGVMLGSIIFGDLSDRFGRKLIFFISLVIQVVFGLIAAVAPEFWTFTFTRAIVGATTSGVFLVAYVIAMEMVGPSDRLAAGVICQMFFSTGYMLTALFAYYIHDWRWLQIALTVPGLIFFSYWWFIPESARWLISKDRVVEAKVLIQRAAKENKVTITNDQLDNLLRSDVKPVDPNEKRATILDIFRHPNLRKRSLIIFFDWFANSITYYGLSWNTSNLGGGNDFINFVISGAVEIPAYTFLLFTLNRWGRKSILCGCMLTAGLALLLTMAVPEDHKWLVVTLAMIGKLAITSSYGTIYIFSVEQFPTIIRNAGLGAASTSARMGSIFAPVINILSEIWTPFPLIIFGLLALSGGIISLVLPETLNQTLPESIADGEAFGKKVKKPEDVPEEVPLKTIEVEKPSNGSAPPVSED